MLTGYVLNSSWQGSYFELSYGRDGMQKACIKLWNIVMDGWLLAIECVPFVQRIFYFRKAQSPLGSSFFSQYASTEQRDLLVVLILQ